MDWIEEFTLFFANMVESDKQEIPFAEFLMVAAQLCDALYYIHFKGIIHRDIKPNNILINTQNIPILIDFDIARSYNYETVTKGSDGHHYFVGHMGYSAPEQI